MQPSIKIVIPGQTPAQKNNKQIVGIRPVGVGLWKGTPTITDNTRVKKWRTETAKYLKEEYPKVTFKDKQIRVYYCFFVKDLRPRDDDNMQTSINDALVAAGIISEDNWKVKLAAGVDVVVDRANPRAELTIFEDEWSIE